MREHQVYRESVFQALETAKAEREMYNQKMRDVVRARKISSSIWATNTKGDGLGNGVRCEVGVAPPRCDQAPAVRGKREGTRKGNTGRDGEAALDSAWA